MLECGPTYELTGPIIASHLTAHGELGADQILPAGVRFTILRSYSSLPSSPELVRIGGNPAFYKIRLANSPAETDEYLILVSLLDQNARPVSTSRPS
jgi:hypothetical protein